MECKDDDVPKTKKRRIYKADVKSGIEMSQDKNSDLKKELKNKDTYKVKGKNEIIRNGIKTLLDEDSDLTEESENDDTHEIKFKDKDVRNEMKTLQNEDNDLKRELKNKDIYEVKCKKENIGNKIKISQDEDSDSTKELENDDTYEIKYKDEDIRNGIKTLQNENSDAKKRLKNKYTQEDGSDDEGVEEEFCSDATYLARQMASKERLCQAELLQLYNLCVQLKHTVPPQHEIETRAGSHMPTRKEIEDFERIIPIKRGSYSHEEDNIITRNWKAFCELHNWGVKRVKPFLQLRIGRLTYMRNTTERRKFVQFLANGLPNRTLYSVYHRFRNLHENNLQRRYKPDEDQMIIDHLEHNPSLDKRRKYADLAKALRRTRNSIWRRYRILEKKKQID